ncbi:hypothetical protein PsYK624_136700 [Phanerochaete sordida]|uniref:Uncharacterized protein n=1 Tax=Phanerochaete sordida TaxID=48140 RepID=A0A9P3LJE1_9APHY|nr:hypothetical protein PsYK624_136700 [Phanerochaete sordida]
MLRSSLAYALRLRSIRLASTSASSVSGLRHTVLGGDAAILIPTALFPARLTSANASAAPAAVAQCKVGTTSAPVHGSTSKDMSIHTTSLAREIRRALGKGGGKLVKVSTDPEVLHVYQSSETEYCPGSDPTVVVSSQCADDVTTIVKLASNM